MAKQSSQLSNNTRIANNTLFLYMRMLLVLIVSLYTTRVVLKALGVVDYGINNVVGGFVSMFAFLNTSMSNGIQRFYNFKRGNEGDASITKVYNTALLIQGALAVIIFFLLETVGLWYLNTKMVIPPERMETARWIYQFSVASLVLVVMQVPYSASIMAHERMSYYAYVSIIEVVLKLLFALWLPLAKSDKLFIYGSYSLGIGILNFLLFFIYSKINFRYIRLEKQFDRVLFKEMISFSGWNVFGTFSYMLKNQGLNVLLNAFFGPIVNAARGVSSMIGNAIQGFQSNIVISFRPQIVQSYAEGNTDRVRRLMYSLSKISYLMLFMLSMPVIIELPFILDIWLGDVVPSYAMSFTVLILLIMLLSSFNTPLSQVVHATGKMKNYQIGTSVIMCAILPVSWIALKLGGNPNVVYIVSLIMTIINQIVCLVLLKKVFPYQIREYLKEVIIPCFLVTVFSVIAPLVLHFVISQSFIRLLFVSAASVSCVALLSYYLVFNDSEKTIITGFIKRFIK